MNNKVKNQAVHYLMCFHGCDKKQINSLSFLKKNLMRAVLKTKIDILHTHFYKFKPVGITGFLLLSSSHVSIHTWPEHNYAACDVFSCSVEKETIKIVDYLIANISHNKVKVKKEKRGYLIN